MSGEMLSFRTIFFRHRADLGRGTVLGAAGESTELERGDFVSARTRLCPVPVGDVVDSGRVVNPLGEAMDAQGPITTKQRAIRWRSWPPRRAGSAAGA